MQDGEVKGVRRFMLDDKTCVRFQYCVPGHVCSKGCDESSISSYTLGRIELAEASWLANSGRMTGRVFRWMRKVLGIPAVELAGLLGVTEGTISRWENDKNPIPVGDFVTLGTIVDDRCEDERLPEPVGFFRLDALGKLRTHAIEHIPPKLIGDLTVILATEYEQAEEIATKSTELS